MELACNSDVASCPKDRGHVLAYIHVYMEHDHDQLGDKPCRLRSSTFHDCKRRCSHLLGDSRAQSHFNNKHVLLNRNSIKDLQVPTAHARGCNHIICEAAVGNSSKRPREKWHACALRWFPISIILSVFVYTYVLNTSSVLLWRFRV